MNLKTLNGQVEFILAWQPKTRNSDVALMIALWEKFFPQYIHDELLVGRMIIIKDLYELPREDNIKRIRAKFQNDKKNPKYLPTSLEVARHRKINEEVWREAMGHDATTFTRI